MKIFTALFSGILFGLGLSVAQMTDPLKVLSFLDITGNWDPSLALVMASALLINIPASMYILRQSKPVYGHKFHIPVYKLIDLKLVAGSVLFGIGWGLSGYCPGPIVTNIGAGSETVFWMFGSYAVGTILVVKLTDLLPRWRLARSIEGTV